MRSRHSMLAVCVLFLAVVLSLITWRVAHWHRIGWTGLSYVGGISPAVEKTLPAILPRSGAIAMILAGSPADRAGLKKGDRIVSIEGAPLARLDEVERRTLGIRRGDTVHYVIERSGIRRGYALQTVSPLSMPMVALHAATDLLIAIVYLAIAGIVFWVRPRARTARVFFWLCTVGAICFGVAAVVEIEVASFDGLMPFISRPFVAVTYFIYAGLGLAMAALLLHFAMIFPRELPLVVRRPYVISWIYAVALTAVMTIGSFLAIGLLARGIGWRPLTVILPATIATGLAVRIFRSGRRLVEQPWYSISTLVAVIVGLTFVVIANVPKDAGTLMGAVVGFLFTISYIAFVLLASVSTIAAFVSGYSGSGVDERTQLRWPLAGTITALTISLLASTAVMFMPDAGSVTVISIGVLVRIVYVLVPLSFAFGILKYRLMAIDVLIQRTAAYSIATATVVGLFLLLVAGIGSVITERLGIHDRTLTIVTTLGLVAVFIPLRNRIQRAIDRRFFQRRLNLDDAARLISQDLVQADELSALMARVVERVHRALNVRSALILAVEPERERLKGLAAIGVPEFTRSETLLTPAQIGTTIEPIGSLLLNDSQRLSLRRMSAALAVPLRARGRTEGVLLLGSKLSGDFDEDDHRFLETVRDQIALAIESLAVSSETREFEQALEIQRTLLPREIAQVAPFDIAARWTPARVVGGDYYDVVRIGDELGVCIADVSGKGMPAALLMATLQAAVRASVRPDLAPEALCARVRDVITSTLEGGRFVTFFFALLNPQKRTMRYVNCGHNPPLLLREGNALSLSEGGAAFARLTRATTYHSTEVSLETGDLIALFTDGVTEAFAADGEPYGEERLIRLLATAPPTSEDVVRRIEEDVTRFVGGAPQDDVTLMAIRVN